MKNLLRVAFYMLVLALLVTACAGSEPEVFEFDYDSETGLVDFGGLKVTYRVNLDSGNGVASTDNYLGYTQNTNFGDLAIQRVSEIQKNYNCVINITTEGTATQFQLLAASGNADCDIYLGPSFNMFNWAKAGFLVGISTLGDYIDYKDSAKWGSAQILESAFYMNDLYGLTPNAWPEQNYTSFGYPLVANIDLITANGARNPRELVEQGRWVWDEFHTELLDNTIVEGSETKSYGLVTSYPYFAQMMILSNGVRFAMVNDAGEYYCGYYTAEGLRAIEEVRDIWQGTYKDTVSRSEEYLSEVVMRNFVNGEGAYAFLPTHFLFGVYGEVAMSLDNFAILPTPTGPDVDPGYVSSTYHTMYYTISFPVFSDKVEAAAMLVNSIYEPLPGFETLEQIKEYMTRNYFFDKSDADAFFALYENATYNYDYTSGFQSRNIPSQICTTTDPTSKILQTNESIIATVFEDYVTPSLNVYGVLWGE